MYVYIVVFTTIFDFINLEYSCFCSNTDLLHMHARIHAMEVLGALSLGRV